MWVRYFSQQQVKWVKATADCLLVQLEVVGVFQKPNDELRKNLSGPEQLAGPQLARKVKRLEALICLLHWIGSMVEQLLHEQWIVAQDSQMQCRVAGRVQDMKIVSLRLLVGGPHEV